MAGTKMMLRRYGNEIIYWDEQEIIVDQAYLDQHKDLYIRLTHPYILGTRMLDVYLNGQHLLAQGGYEEVDENTIRLDLGTYPQEHPLAGEHIPLVVGDEIYIRTWKPEYRQGGGSGIDDLRFKRLEEEIVSARKYTERDVQFHQLDDRLDYIQERAEAKTMVFVLERVPLGPCKYEMRFPFEGKIKEIYASCGVYGTSKSEFSIEKCSQLDYETLPSWTNIFSRNLTIQAGEKSSNTSPLPYILSDPIIHKNDHFRINTHVVGEGLKGLTLEIVVTL
ncbi:hypothetical protein ACWHAM_00245 [Paenibacillus terrae]